MRESEIEFHESFFSCLPVCLIIFDSESRTRLFLHEKSSRLPAGWTSSTSPFSNLEPENPRIDEFYVVQERLAKDFKAPKFRQGSSG